MNMLLRYLESVQPANFKFESWRLRRLIEGKLWAQVLVGMVFGVALGIALNPDTGWVSPSVASAIGEWIALPGKLFLALIQLIVVPLILASIVRGIAAATNTQQLRSVGRWLGIYLVGTLILAVMVGIGIGIIVRPGSFVHLEQMASVTTEAATLAETASEAAQGADVSSLSMADLPNVLTALIPTNPMSSIVEGDMLQIVIFALIFGIGLLSLPPASSRPLLELFGSVQEVCMAIVAIAMRFAPVAVFGLLAQAMIRTGPQVLTGLAIYAGAVVVGMVLLLVIYLTLATVLGGRNPLKVLVGIRDPLLLAFSTNSSAATMPVSIRSAEEKLGVRSSVAQLVIPLGATVNMGGTALYQGLATVFMAQMYDIDLGLGALLALVFTAVGASIGTPAVPGVGIIVLAGVLSSAGVPLTGLALIVGVDQVLERFRASLNVTGDLVACILIQRVAPPEPLAEGPQVGQEEPATV